MAATYFKLLPRVPSSPRLCASPTAQSPPRVANAIAVRVSGVGFDPTCLCAFWTTRRRLIHGEHRVRVKNPTRTRASMMDSTLKRRKRSSAWSTMMASRRESDNGTSQVRHFIQVVFKFFYTCFHGRQARKRITTMNFQVDATPIMKKTTIHLRRRADSTLNSRKQPRRPHPRCAQASP